MIIDPIGDLLTRIRNAYLARIIEVKLPYSKIKLDISKILKKLFQTGFFLSCKSELENHIT